MAEVDTPTFRRLLLGVALESEAPVTQQASLYDLPTFSSSKLIEDRFLIFFFFLLLAPVSSHLQLCVKKWEVDAWYYEGVEGQSHL